MIQSLFDRWYSRPITSSDDKQNFTRNTVILFSIVVLFFFVGVLSFAEWVVSPSLSSKPNVASQSSVPTMMPTVFPTMIPTAEAIPERVKPIGPPEPVPLPPRPENLSLVAIGMVIVVYVMVIVLQVTNRIIDSLRASNHLKSKENAEVFPQH
jgi:hypothetical protein